MSTITREQLIEKLEHRIAVTANYPDVEEAQLDAAIFKIALASLEAEAVAWLYSASFERGHVEGELTDAPGCDMPVYTSPPAPVSVPDELSRDEYKRRFMEDDDFDDTFRGGWNACRAAMLQGADGNSPVIPDGWVACSELMPDIGTEIFYFCQDDGLRGCGIVSSSNFSGRGDAQLYVHADGYELRFGVDITHWMPLPAAPQHG